jgi:hypothetical protein
MNNEIQKTEETNRILTPIQAKWQEAQYLAQSSLLPKQFINQPANVLIALEYAKQLSTSNKQLSPIAVMQNLYVVHGNCGLSSKFMIALANTSGVFDHPIRFETKTEKGKIFSVRAFTSIGDVKIEYTVDMNAAAAEGWDKNPKYKSLPQLMLSYRAAAFLIRLNCPEVIMGLQTEDDIIEVEEINQVSQSTSFKDVFKKEIAGDVIDEDLL